MLLDVVSVQTNVKIEVFSLYFNKNTGYKKQLKCQEKEQTCYVLVCS